MNTADLATCHAQIGNPQSVACNRFVMQANWRLAKAAAGHPISRERLARLIPAHDIEARAMTGPEAGEWSSADIVPTHQRVTMHLNAIKARRGLSPRGGDAA